MAGHSKWANIKHKKAKEDAKRGSAFTKLIKEITVAARDGGGDPDGNPRLRTLLDNARKANMPNDNVTRAIKKGTGELPGVTYESFTYEGYAPNNVAVIVEVLTDNKNRAVAAIRSYFSKHGGNLGESGSVGWMFSKSGIIHVGKTGTDEDSLFEILMEHDVNDISEANDIFIINCQPNSLEAVKTVLEDSKLTVEHAKVELISSQHAELTDEKLEKSGQFLGGLEDLDDVQNVYSNIA
ncbi:YebC/PmpR family DNA-binding transcriptional regulator [bacterium]|jgi:YebC/PmpR family DNA-binding regulatory protein|nr:YebC/PmpR family DNA-binding transcriptional regulator [bacterium]MBT3903962.1 YebC/PmpR family DNA-binding transcriptional regulator [bacterium]MBT4577743.1 YebC/PmpR family DNA-binding transcriptional regulator [bacterium]MBT5346066.1 YebC/PmpR family DNA-binding transcriptional regulator [bacterium]MBT6130810.1 YebC/PmpR family DNA-binding transcriptional regulator [bacterium]